MYISHCNLFSLNVRSVCVCNCVCVCFAGFRPLRCCAPTVCVCSLVGTLWAVLRGAQSHSANGASGTASESIRPHYSSCSATVLFPPLLSSPPSFSPHPSTLLSFPFPPVHAVSPVWRAIALLRLLEHTSHPQRERERERETITAGSSHTD